MKVEVDINGSDTIGKRVLKSTLANWNQQRDGGPLTFVGTQDVGCSIFSMPTELTRRLLLWSYTKDLALETVWRRCASSSRGWLKRRRMSYLVPVFAMSFFTTKQRGHGQVPLLRIVPRRTLQSH